MHENGISLRRHNFKGATISTLVRALVSGWRATNNQFLELVPLSPRCDPISLDLRPYANAYSVLFTKTISLLLRHLLKTGELLLPLILSFPMSLHKSVD